MTMAEAQDLLGTWEQEPPALVLLARIEAMIAAWFGVRRSPAGGLPTSDSPGIEPDPAALAQSTLFEHFGAPARGAPGDAAVYDFEALKARHAPC